MILYIAIWSFAVWRDIKKAFKKTKLMEPKIPSNKQTDIFLRKADVFEHKDSKTWIHLFNSQPPPILFELKDLIKEVEWALIAVLEAGTLCIPV